MINRCPHCGHTLKNAILDGITSCGHCNRVFDASPFHRLLAASWIVRRQNLESVEGFIQLGYTKDEAEMVIHFVADKCYSHEDFVKVLTELGISKQYQICIDRAG